MIATLDLSLHLYQNIFAFILYTGEEGAIAGFATVSSINWGGGLTRVTSF